jgi:hypothetical protein
MAALFVLLWIVGGLPAATLGEVVRADSPRIRRVGRTAFALLLGFDLLLAAAVFAVGADAPTAHMTRSLWWFTIIAAGIPLALVSGLAVRPAYTGRHLSALALATLATAALYVAFPLGFNSVQQGSLTGLGRWEHDHHLLGIAILLIPTLILLADELSRRGEAEDAPESDRAGLRSLIHAIPRGALIGTGVTLLALILWAGTNGPGEALEFGVVLAGSAFFLWRKNRSEMRRVMQDLKPPESS